MALECEGNGYGNPAAHAFHDLIVSLLIGLTIIRCVDTWLTAANVEKTALGLFNIHSMFLLILLHQIRIFHVYLRLSSDPSYLGIEKKLRGPELALHLLLGLAGMLLLYVIATKFSEWRSSSYLAIAFLSYTVTIMLWELTVLRPNVDRTGRLYRTISHWLQIDTVLVVLLLIVSAVTYSHVTFCINVWIVALIVLAGALDHMISYDWYLTNDGIARK